MGSPPCLHYPLVGGLVLLAPAQSLAQEKHKLARSARPENTKFTYQHQLEIPDTPGHFIQTRADAPDGVPTPISLYK